MQKAANEAFDKVKAYLRKHPDASIRTAMKATGVKESNYYRGSRIARGVERRSQKISRAPKTETLVAAADSGKLMVLIGTIEQIRGVIS